MNRGPAADMLVDMSSARSGRRSLLLAAGVCVAAVGCSRPPAERWEAIEDLRGMKALRGFAVEEETARRNASAYALRRDEVAARIEVVRGIDAASADVLRNEGRVGLEALYSESLSPYPDDISHTIVPRPEYQPRWSERDAGGTRVGWFLLFANDRLGYGAATPEAARYKSLLGWFYRARTERLYTVKLFAPAGWPDARLESIFLSIAAE